MKTPRNTSRAARARRTVKADEEGTRVVIRQRLGRKPPPPNESKRDRFKRIGERRMNEVLSKIALLGNLSSASYDVTGEDVAAIRETIVQGLDAALARFTPRRSVDRKRFQFNHHHAHN